MKAPATQGPESPVETMPKIPDLCAPVPSTTGDYISPHWALPASAFRSILEGRLIRNGSSDLLGSPLQ